MKKVYIGLICFIIALFSYLLVNNKSTSKDLSSNINPSNIKLDENYIDVNLTAVGDILVHETQLLSQYNEVTKSYDFTSYFNEIKPYISNSDFSIANIETSLGGKEKTYSGYPLFNTPDEILYALKKSGFNMVTAANNHILDRGTDGLIRSAKTIKNHNLDLVGIKDTENSKTYLIKNIKGINIGFSNFVFETPMNKGNKTINSIVLDKNAEKLIDTFDPSNMEETLNKLKKRVNTMKKEGAEVLVFYMHWGDEYNSKPNAYQISIAKALNDYGVDVIIGSHPHVIQPMEFLYSSKTSKETLVAYSLGNFISNQRYDIVKKEGTEDGVILNFTIRKSLDDNSIKINKVDYIPTWVNKTPIGEEKYSYSIIPLHEEISEITSKYNKETLGKINASRRNTVNIMESFNSRFTVAPLK
ncbi:CapA family protein [Clostridium hydrogeniformans]|uniref:CapA family protein n=1 Tax=Clostridium hydrogeniformans TaxID=349933 RepID=UPI00068C1B44|nr:CapA family protein [Clostridium hydrogeniformans]